MNHLSHLQASKSETINKIINVSPEIEKKNTSPVNDIDHSVPIVQEDLPVKDLNEDAIHKPEDLPVKDLNEEIINKTEVDFKEIIEPDVEIPLRPEEIKENLLTEKMIKDLTEVTDLVEGEFHFDRKTSKCIFTQTYMNFLPEFEHVKTDLFTLLGMQKDQKITKCYRTLGLNLYKQLKLLIGNMDKDSDGLDDLQILRNAKNTYYTHFLHTPSTMEKKNKDENQTKREETMNDWSINRLTAELNKLKTKFEKDRKRNNKLNEDAEKNLLKHKEVLLKNEKPSFDDLIKDRTILMTQIENITALEDYQDMEVIDKDMISHYGGRINFIKLKKLLYERNSMVNKNKLLLKMHSIMATSGASQKLSDLFMMINTNKSKII